VHVASDRDLVDVRFPVRRAAKSEEHHDYRGYAGRSPAACSSRDEVVVLPA
jgi:sulfate adenylyltransferase subunit 1 (EFTu-like GTPase family)